VFYPDPGICGHPQAALEDATLLSSILLGGSLIPIVVYPPEAD